MGNSKSEPPKFCGCQQTQFARTRKCQVDGFLVSSHTTPQQAHRQTVCFDVLCSLPDGGKVGLFYPPLLLCNPGLVLSDEQGDSTTQDQVKRLWSNQPTGCVLNLQSVSCPMLPDKLVLEASKNGHVDPTATQLMLRG